MLGRWKKIQISKIDFQEFIKSAFTVLENSRTIILVPNNTQANWLGVKNATMSMFPHNHIILPQSYSNSLLSEVQRDEFTKTIINKGVKLVIFSGIPNYAIDWIRQFHQKDIKCGVIYHGGLAELASNPTRQIQLTELLKLSNSGIIERIGVVKEGLDDWFKLKTKAKIFRVIPNLKPPTGIKFKKFTDGKIHIGIFGNSSYNKNRHTQVVAASLIENSIIHILSPNEFDYALPPERLVIHENLNHHDFLTLLGSMHVNLYCSYSESWGQVVLESLVMETPCVTTSNSGLLKWDEELTKYLVVQHYDNISAIKKHIENILENYEIISELGKNYISTINKISDEYLDKIIAC